MCKDCYPMHKGFAPLAIDLQGRPDGKRFNCSKTMEETECFEQAVMENKGRNLIMSSEEFSRVNKTGITKLVEILDGYDLTFVLFYRNKADICKSTYTQITKRNLIWKTFEEHLIDCISSFEEMPWRYCPYVEETLETLKELGSYADLHVISFDSMKRQKLHPFDFLMEHIVGIPMTTKTYEPRNETLAPEENLRKLLGYGDPEDDQYKGNVAPDFVTEALKNRLIKTYFYSRDKIDTVEPSQVFEVAELFIKEKSPELTCRDFSRIFLGLDKDDVSCLLDLHNSSFNENPSIHFHLFGKDGMPEVPQDAGKVCIIGEEQIKYNWYGFFDRPAIKQILHYHSYKLGAPSPVP